MKTIINGLEITTGKYGSISFNNNQNNFWVTAEEVKKEVSGDWFYNSLKLACNLAGIDTVKNLLNKIKYCPVS